MSDSNRLYLGNLDESADAHRVGPFLLSECVGEGSMGEVWRGHHVQQDVEVAVKVIHAEQTTDRQRHQAFRQEARSIAELHHPFIVDVVDYGTVDESTTQSSYGHFEQGSPYLVMDYAEHGSLASHLEGPTPWPVVQAILYALLDALAHSHARGVLHRDVKPQNVLISSTGTGHGIELTDFGLAYALRTSQEAAEWHLAAGTPEYMSPEQLNARWRDYGPSTDLYGLGCLAWEMLTGAPPFEGDNAIQLAHAHLKASLPALPGDIEAPAAIESWLETMLSKHPRHRYQSAADAAWALRQLTGRLETSELPTYWNDLLQPPITGAASPQQSRPSLTPVHSLEVILDDASEWAATDSDGGASNISFQRPIPESWRRTQTTISKVRMIGAGSGLVGLRRLPVVNRTDERDRMWSRLRRCAHQEQPNASLISGPVGIGKDCLARWLCDRAEELGVAQIFRVSHETSDEYGNSLGEMLEDKYSLDGLTRPQIESFFESLLGELGVNKRYSWEALSEVVKPASGDETTPQLQFKSPSQRYRSVIRFLEVLSQRGPIVLWFQDIEWGIDSLNFVRTLLEAPEVKAPIHIVLTSGDDLSSTDADHRQILETIAESRHTERIDLGPLDDDAMRKLVEKTMFLDPSAAYEVLRRSGGNPLYARETVSSWLDQDLLVAGRNGYEFRGNADPAPTGEWIDIWSRTVDRLVGDQKGKRIVLELAALLGDRFQRSTWRRAAELADVEFDEQLLRLFVERRYLSVKGDDFVFVQSLLKQALLTSARQHNRRRQLAEYCVEAIDETADSPQIIDERSAFLLSESGHHRRAAQRFLQAAKHRRKQREPHSMTYLARRGLRAIEAMKPERARKTEVQLLEILSHGWHNLNKTENALEVARRGRELAEELGPPWTGLLDMRLVGALNYVGQTEQALELAQSVDETLEEYDEYRPQRSQALSISAHIAFLQGDWDEALSMARRARELVDTQQHRYAAGQADTTHLKIKILGGEDVPLSEVISLYERCREERITVGELTNANLVAELARRKDQLDMARKWYQKTLDIAERFDPDRAIVPHCNLGILAIEQGDIPRAGRRASRLLQNLRRTTRPQMKMYCHALRLPMLLRNGDLDRSDECLTSITNFVDSLQLADNYDLELCLRAAVDELDHDDDSQQSLLKRLEELLTVVSVT